MDWLCQGVEGRIPSFDELLPHVAEYGAAAGTLPRHPSSRGRGGSVVRILVVADEESKYYWDYYRPGRLDGIDLTSLLRRF